MTAWLTFLIEGSLNISVPSVNSPDAYPTTRLKAFARYYAIIARACHQTHVWIRGLNANLKFGPENWRWIHLDGKQIPS